MIHSGTAERSHRVTLTLLITGALLGAACGSTARQTAGSGEPQSGSGAVVTSLDRNAVAADDGSATASPDAGAARTGTAAPGPGGAGDADNTASGQPGVAVEDSSAATVSSSGPGWDAEHAYIGVTVVTSLEAVGGDLGLEAVDFGDQVAMAEAVADDINARGGVFGRDLVPVFHDQDLSQSDDVNAQAACVQFTEDRPVFAAVVLLPYANSETFYECMRQHQTPMIAHSQLVFSDTLLERYAPYLSYIDDIAYERLVPMWLDRLAAQRYFNGWDTAAGDAGPAPVKAGFLHQRSPVQDQGYRVLKQALEARGTPVAEEMTYGSYTDQHAFQNAVLRFKSAGVTHVFMDLYASFIFPTAAEQQAYRPRYGVTTQNFLLFTKENVPERQLHGAVGIGWVPTSDVEQAQDPGDSEGAASCKRIMHDAGVAMETRQAQLFALLLCDTMRLYVEAAAQGGGLAAPATDRGLGLRAPGFSFGSNFGATADASRRDRMGFVRDIGYDATCRCFQYRGDKIPV